MPQRYKEIFIALACSVTAYLTANAAEFIFISALHPSEIELTWISDAFLSISLGVVAYLWLHLKVARKEFADSERTRIVVDTELSLAAEIQRNLLPAVPGPVSGLRWAARLKQAERVGGDFYDFVRPDANSILMILGDISGKGIPAALQMSSIRTLFRMLSQEIHQPSDLVKRLSEILYEENRGSMFLTCLMGLFDLDRHTLTLTNAGHPPGLILTPSGRYLLAAGGTPAGMFPSSSYESQTVDLEPGTIGIFFTDGISEAIEHDGRKAADIVGAAVSTIPSPLDPDAVCDRLVVLAQNGAGPTGDGEWKDDQTILSFVVEEDHDGVTASVGHVESLGVGAHGCNKIGQDMPR
jgi:sigma-B regulation protein RsbU (phosphoserine phosphatase)